jgi:hypothetical protein
MSDLPQRVFIKKFGSLHALIDIHELLLRELFPMLEQDLEVIHYVSAVQFLIDLSFTEPLTHIVVLSRIFLCNDFVPMNSVKFNF